MIQFADNIKHLRVLKNLTQQALAEQLDITRGQLVSYEDGRAEPKLEVLNSYSRFFNIPIDALIKNDLTQTQENHFLKLEDGRVLFPIQIDSQEEELIEYIPEKASAGYLRGYSDPEYIADLPQIKLPFLNNGKYRAFPIKGDSMEPWVQDGSIIIGQYVESLVHIKNGEPYIVITQEDGINYKRVYTDNLRKGELLMKSDNPAYQPYIVKSKDVKEIWSFSCKIDFSDRNHSEINVFQLNQSIRKIEEDIAYIKTTI